MTDLERVEQLAQLCGVSGCYEDWSGNAVTVPTEYKIPLLKAMGLNLDSDEAVLSSIRELHQQQWQQLIPPVCVFTQGEPYKVTIQLPEDKAGVNLRGQVTLETGKEHKLLIDTEALDIQATASVDNDKFVRLLFELPEDLPLGYHHLQLKHRNLEGNCLVIIAPAACYEPETLASGRKIWGTSVQLYTVRTEHDWGMGDFSSLKYLAEKMAEQGADIIGLNPIHSLYPANPWHCSPYSPSSRNFINPLYIDVTQVTEFSESEDAEKRFQSEEFQRLLNQARAEDYVDYGLVAHLKLPFLTLLFDHFQHHHLKNKSKRGKEFLNFCKARGASLEQQALYEAIFEHYKALDSNSWGWPCWEEPFQSPDSVAVETFSKNHRERVRFFMYLQWLAESQLHAAQEAAKEAGMLVGIYRDLAVGVDRGGADVWGNRSIYCLEAGVGAPPDAVAPQGQNWGLPPFNPLTLKQRHYAPYIEMVRSNMHHCGALRIDHVMGLLRLWWCPVGKTADFGAYVYNPFNDLLGIIKLESYRRQCLVFGEDLGTVPPEIESALPPALFYSNEVVLFECLGSHFTPPEDFKPMALTCISNHDIPTLKAWWECRDLDLRFQLGIYDEQKTQQEKENRHREKVALLRTMIEAGEAPHGMNPDDINTLNYSHDFMEKAHYFLAKTASKIVVLQLEDMLQIDSPVNIPGTSEEYPNWKRRLTDTLENLFENPAQQSIFKNMNLIRRG